MTNRISLTLSSLLLVGVATTASAQSQITPVPTTPPVAQPQQPAQSQPPVPPTATQTQQQPQSTIPMPAPSPRAYVPTGTPSQRILEIARRENRNWYSPFIATDGGLRTLPVTEAERSRLNDGSEAWQKVTEYWRDGNTLGEMVAGGRPGASACESAFGMVTAGIRADCRGFIIDTPWSAAFISYVMTKAQIPGFHVSPRHIDYIRDAFANRGPYFAINPGISRPQIGDLLCYVRLSRTIIGYDGLRAALAANPSLNQAAHCDVVVRTDFTGHFVETIGGNVENAVTLRKLQLDAQNLLVLPRPVNLVPQGEEGDIEAGCSPDNESACSFNRQNWAALLRLRDP
ncbi:MAG: DUF2272 domain-containing protein [Proteobacteria bacterium]|nr:DUF2272 domain-containing protein [Pseudomonadota bacterium]